MEPISWFISHLAWDTAKKLLIGVLGTTRHEELLYYSFKKVREEDKKLSVIFRYF